MRTLYVRDRETAADQTTETRGVDVREKARCVSERSTAVHLLREGENNGVGEN